MAVELLLTEGSRASLSGPLPSYQESWVTSVLGARVEKGQHLQSSLGSKS